MRRIGLIWQRELFVCWLFLKINVSVYMLHTGRSNVTVYLVLFRSCQWCTSSNLRQEQPLKSLQRLGRLLEPSQPAHSAYSKSNFCDMCCSWPRLQNCARNRHRLRASWASQSRAFRLEGICCLGCFSAPNWPPALPESEDRGFRMAANRLKALASRNCFRSPFAFWICIRNVRV